MERGSSGPGNELAWCSAPCALHYVALLAKAGPHANATGEL